MKPETIIEVVGKLVGPVEPQGETHTDTKRYENLETMCAVADHLLSEIKQVSLNADRHEFSMSHAGKRAKRFLDQALDYNEDLAPTEREGVGR